MLIKKSEKIKKKLLNKAVNKAKKSVRGKNCLRYAQYASRHREELDDGLNR